MTIVPISQLSPDDLQLLGNNFAPRHRPARRLSVAAINRSLAMHGEQVNCSACDEPTCSGCGNKCKGCKAFVYDGCIEDQLCPDCREKEESDGEPATVPEFGGNTEAIPLPFRGTRRQRRRNRHRIAA